MAKKNESSAGAAPAAETKLAEATHLAVRARTDGFRRAGRAWPAADTVVPIGELSDGQVRQLMDEPLLLVTPVVPPAEPK